MLKDTLSGGHTEKYVEGIDYRYNSAKLLWTSNQRFSATFNLPYKNIFGQRYLDFNGTPSNISPYLFEKKSCLSNVSIKLYEPSVCMFKMILNNTCLDKIYLLNEKIKSYDIEMTIPKESEMSFIVTTPDKINYVSVDLFYHYCF